MAIYEVIDYFDVWGNAAEGYTVNDQTRSGELAIRKDATDRQLVEAMIADGHLGKLSLEYFESGILQVEDRGDAVELSETEEAWVYTGGRGEAEYLDYDVTITAHDVAEAEGHEQDEEHYELIAGQKPLFGLHLIYSDLAAKPFWRGKVLLVGKSPSPDKKQLHAVVELRINPQQERRPEVEVFIDDDFFGAKQFPDDFEHDILLGLAKDNSVIDSSVLDIGLLRVALDAFLERDGEGAPEFLEGEKDARRIFKAIRENVDAHFNDEKTYEAFSAKQRELWDEAGELGVHERVQELLRSTPHEVQAAGTNRGRPTEESAGGRSAFQPYLIGALYDDGMRDVANAWDVEFWDQNIDDLRRDPRAWAEHYVQSVHDEDGEFHAVSSLEEDWILTPEEREQLSRGYARGATTALTERAQDWIRWHDAGEFD